MKRTIEYAKRNLIELARDPLGYIFCIAFPIVMLIIMSVVNESIPKEASMTLFNIDNLVGGIIVFGQTFVMLFTAILVATDRSSSFLTRLFSSPMKSRDFTVGYIIPMILIGVIQGIVTGIAAYITACVTNSEVSVPGLLTAVVLSIPSCIMFISIGLFFGTLLNDKAAPGLCSVIISLGTFMGGIFFDAEGVGGAIYKVCRCLPFIYCTRVARCSVKMDFSWDYFGKSFVIVSFAALTMGTIATLFFNTKMKADK